MCPYSIKLSFTFRAAVKEICIPTFLWPGSRVVYEMNIIEQYMSFILWLTCIHKENAC